MLVGNKCDMLDKRVVTKEEVGYEMYSKTPYDVYRSLSKNLRRCCMCHQLPRMWFVNFFLMNNTWLTEIVKITPRYTQSPFIRTSPIRTNAEFLWKFKTWALGSSNLRTTSKNLRTASAQIFKAKNQFVDESTKKIKKSKLYCSVQWQSRWLKFWSNTYVCMHKKKGQNKKI